MNVKFKDEILLTEIHTHTAWKNKHLNVKFLISCKHKHLPNARWPIKMETNYRWPCATMMDKKHKHLSVFTSSFNSDHHHSRLPILHFAPSSWRGIGSIRPCLTKKATACLINSVVTSHLNFYNSTLTGITSDQINRLQRVQNCAAGLIAKRESVSISLLSSLSFTGCLEILHSIQTGCFGFPPFSGYFSSIFLSSVLHTYQPPHVLRSSSEKLLKIPCVNLQPAGERSFHFAAPSVWNSLPSSVHNIAISCNSRLI